MKSVPSLLPAIEAASDNAGAAKRSSDIIVLKRQAEKQSGIRRIEPTGNGKGHHFEEIPGTARHGSSSILGSDAAGAPNTKAPLNRNVRFALGAAIAILLVVGAFSYRSMVSSSEGDRKVQHSLEILENVQALLVAMTEIESSNRGFALTGDNSDLESYRASALSAQQHEATLRKLTADNAEQQRRLPPLDSLVAQKIQFSETVIGLRQTNGLEAAAQAVQSKRGERVMNAFKAGVTQFENEELRLLALRNANAERDLSQAKTVLIFGTLLGLLIAAAAGWTVQRDASRRGIAEEALRDSHDQFRTLGVKYRALMEAAPDAMVVVNQAGEIVLLNLQAEKQFGYRRDELVGQKVKNIIPQGFAERLIADGTRTAAEALAQQIGMGIELTARRKDGSEFPIELMLSPLENAEGILVTAAIRDISVRKDAEIRLAQMEGRYRGLLEAAPDAMVVVNQAGGIVLLNLQAEKQFGYYRDELVGQKVTNIIPQGFAERLIADGTRTAAEALAQQIGMGIELTARRKDGSEFPIELMLSPLENAEGILVTAAIRDISTRKEAEKALRQQEALERKSAELTRSNDDLQQFAYVAAHDLQEPLRMVASYTQLLSKRYTGRLDADADEFIAYAVDGAHRMQLLIADLLAYCRVGTTGKDPQETSSEAALEQALLNLRGAIQESGAVVTHDPLPSVTADGAQLAQLFQNIVGNAVKYHGPRPPRIHVSARKTRANEWVFSMRDNGIGIAPQHFEKIFVMFQRLHGRKEFSGTGIGLTLCKKIAERHGGRMWVDSDLGNGSTFFLALPERVQI